MYSIYSRPLLLLALLQVPESYCTIVMRHNFAWLHGAMSVMGTGQMAAQDFPETRLMSTW